MDQQPMSSRRFFSSILLVALLATGLTGITPLSLHATEVRRTEPYRDDEPLISRTGKKSAAAVTRGNVRHASEQPDMLHQSLLAFARKCIDTMNHQRRPGITSKEVVRQADGTYRARYMAIDPDSLTASFNPTEGNAVVRYIGRMEYHEVEYISLGKNQKQALAGPFSESNRMPVTELVKFKGGKWTY